MNTILVVDDDQVTRHLIRGLLEAAGFSVQLAEGAQQALEQMAHRDYDLLLVDVWMPGMNGLELLARLRDQPKRPRVIVMTADDTPVTLLRAVREQAHQVVRKPVQGPRLIELIRQVLESKTESRPIQVISAKPDWVELLVPCDRGAADRIQALLSQLDTDLPADVRATVGQAFHELLMNAIEWGGQLDPTRDVRISYLRANRMLLYRIADPGKGFTFKDLTHAAVANPDDRPLEHVDAREQRGLRAGGFGILMTRALVDELIYNEAHNEVIFVKYLD